MHYYRAQSEENLWTGKPTYTAGRGRVRSHGEGVDRIVEVIAGPHSATDIARSELKIVMSAKEARALVQAITAALDADLAATPNGVATVRYDRAND